MTAYEQQVLAILEAKLDYVDLNLLEQLIDVVMEAKQDGYNQALEDS